MCPLSAFVKYGLFTWCLVDYSLDFNNLTGCGVSGIHTTLFSFKRMAGTSMGLAYLVYFVPPFPCFWLTAQARWNVPEAGIGTLWLFQHLSEPRSGGDLVTEVPEKKNCTTC